MKLPVLQLIAFGLALSVTSCVTVAESNWKSDKSLQGVFVTDCHIDKGVPKIEVLSFAEVSVISQAWNFDSNDTDCKGNSLESITRSRIPSVTWISDSEFILYFQGPFENYSVMTPGRNISDLFENNVKLGSYPERAKKASVRTGIIPTLPRPKADCYTRVKTTKSRSAFAILINSKSGEDCFSTSGEAVSANGAWSAPYWYKEAIYSGEARFKDIKAQYEKALE